MFLGPCGHITWSWLSNVFDKAVNFAYEVLSLLRIPFHTRSWYYHLFPISLFTCKIFQTGSVGIWESAELRVLTVSGKKGCDLKYQATQQVTFFAPSRLAVRFKVSIYLQKQMNLRTQNIKYTTFFTVFSWAFFKIDEQIITFCFIYVFVLESGLNDADKGPTLV